MPYAYQNGRLKLLKPVPFQSAETDQWIWTACRYAVQGESLFSHPDPRWAPLQLCVIGRFRSGADSAAADVQRILRQHDVRPRVVARLMPDYLRRGHRDLRRRVLRAMRSLRR